MKRLFRLKSTIGFLIFCCGTSHLGAQQPAVRSKANFNERAIVGKQDDGSYVVPTSQIIDPAGNTISFSGRPMDLALNPDETVLAVKNLYNIVFFDVVSQLIKQTLSIPDDGGNTFTGILWSDNGQKVWTTDTRGFLRSAKLQQDGTFAWDDAISLPAKILSKGKFAWEDQILYKSVKNKDDRAYPGGFAIDEEKQLIYVTLNRDNAIGVIDMRTNKFIDRVNVGIAPYTIVLKGSKAYVTNWGGRIPKKGDKTATSSRSQIVVNPKNGVASSGTVSVIDLISLKVIKEIKVHLHPSAMVFHPDSSRLYIANANSDLISVIDTEKDELIQNIDPKPIKELPFGSAPNALAISADGNALYVANGGNNLLAVVDLSTKKVKGLIPVGWYPGAVVLTKDGTKLFVANTKGLGSRNKKPDAKGYQYSDHLGSVSFIPVPDKERLEEYTIRAATNIRLPEITQYMQLNTVKETIVPVPTKPGEKSVFKHVLYIIKENKTYDQVFGDIKQGNGDSSLCIFGRNVTPNQHALAEGFVLLDNMYCNGVLSADGHQWTNEGYVTDYLEKSFGDFIRSYPYEGDDPLAYASSGFIWDKVLERGLRFRNYGEFVHGSISPKSATWTDIYNDYKNGTNKIKVTPTAELHTIRPYLCPTFIGFPSTVPDVHRAREFIKELHGFEANGSFPNFMIMLLPNDHTTGTQEGYPTPAASVADNDLAVGQIVEAISKSKFWKETVIFVIQDDPQSGFDHVDGKRTTALCISPYTKRGEVISTQYNQNSVLRTIELILGLTPMSQFDLMATPMTDCFTTVADFTPYSVLPNQIPLDQMNPKLSTLKGKQLYWAKRSHQMEFGDVDEADDDELNKIIWYSMKGYDAPYPVIRK
jgi:YVTN family beta-propeller protein